MRKQPVKIDLENHFATPKFQEALATNKGFPKTDRAKGLGFAADAWLPLSSTGAKLADMGEGRLRLMDEAGVDYAILSLTSPGAEQFEVEVGRRVAEDANDVLAGAIQEHPDRFGGFATLAPKDPEWSAQELERCVKDLGFKGWETHSNYGDSYLDEERYWPLLAKAEELDIVIYLHPAVPKIPELREFGMVLAGPTFGFGVEVSYVFLRMIVRGVFDRFPNLKIMMGHLGEAFPFLVDRVDRAYMQGHQLPNPGFGPGSAHVASYYVRRNLWVTTSGNYLPAAMVCTKDGLGMDRLLLGTDYPYEDMGDCLSYLAGLPLTDEEKAQLFETNARGLGI
jgi:predicted TIM-barrel fold metal-dependent hydrolase